MNKFLLALILACFSFTFYAQDFSQASPGAVGVDSRIVEVFGDQLNVLVLNDRDRLKSLEDILGWRTEITQIGVSENEKLPKLSTIPLFNKYNPDLKRDEVFDPATFNVLKYKLPFYSQYKKMFRVDNTNYVISILPKKRN